MFENNPLFLKMVIFSRINCLLKNAFSPRSIYDELFGPQSLFLATISHPLPRIGSFGYTVKDLVLVSIVHDPDPATLIV